MILIPLFSAITLVLTGLMFGPINPMQHPQSRVLSTHQMSLTDRYQVPSVNDVFKDNILLNIAYMNGRVASPRDINWNSLNKPFQTHFILQPGEMFAFHDDVLPQFEGKVTKTTKAHFNAQEGFKSDGYLFGDGVCHLASLIGWAARDAQLDVVAPTNHDFMTIPEIPSKYGVSIYAASGESSVSEQQNLYIKNNFKKPIAFVFDYKNEQLKVSVLRLD